jgi:signal transduction histidine kinase
MPTPTFSKDLTSIFNTNSLPEDIKYDLSCRLVAESLQVATVSMLIYEPQTDTLKCLGNYIAPRTRSHYNTFDPDLPTIIDNLSVFDYLDAGHVDYSEMTFDNYISSVFHGETKTEHEVTRDLFVKLKSGWTGPAGYPAIYRAFRRGLHLECHALDSSSLSGRFFLKMLKVGNSLTTEVERMPLISAPLKGKPFFDAWNSMKISIPPDGLYYIGLPIFATGRYTGILRLTTTRNPKSAIDDLLEESQPQKSDVQAERLNNFAQLISLHLRTSYYLNGYRALDQLRIPQLFGRNAVVNLDSLCDTLVEIIRCRGCILRLSTSAYDITNPPIRGVSNSLVEYRSYATSPQSSAFSEDITEILKAKNKHLREIKAINFSITSGQGSDTFETLEYYYENVLLKSEKIADRKFRDFDNEYIKLLEKLNMREIVVVRIDSLEGAFIVLTNTSHKKFTGPDIEIILLASRRIGLEIKQQRDSQRIQEQNKIISQEENARLIVHQIGAPVRALSGHAQNLDDRIFQEKEIPLKISQLNKMAFSLMRQLGSLQKYMDWEIKPLVPKRDHRFSLERHIRSLAIQFEGLMVGRTQKIWTIIENPLDFYDEVTMDRGMLDEILNCLIDNAVKYSFYVYELASHGISFDPGNPESPGHVHILLRSTREKIIITVRNWGCTIDPGELNKIFERGIRGKYGKKRSPVGSGIGLYLAKKVVDAYEGKIEASHDKTNRVTNFKVTIPHA